MPRYATLIIADDGAEIVSAIGEFESAPHRPGRVEQVPSGVLIGMVRGGPLDAVSGFGFPSRGLDLSSVSALTARLQAASGSPVPKAIRAKPRKKPARKRARTKAAVKAPAIDAGAHG